MAKSGAMNIVEQHLEKLLLGVCVLLLAGFWLVPPPREIDLSPATSDGPVRPARVDETLLAYATSVDTQVAGRVDPSAGAGPGNYEEEIASLQAPSNLGDMTAGGLPGTEIASPQQLELQKVSLPDLVAAMPSPGVPKVKAVRDLPNIPTARPADVLAAHGVAIYPWGELRDAWRAKLKKSGVPLRVVALGVVVQVQERQEDGSWGPARTVDTTSVATDEATQQPSDAVKVPDIPPYDGTNLEYISELRGVVGDPNGGWQSYILQPSYWQIWWPGHGWADWLVNLPSNEVTEEAATLADANAKPAPSSGGMQTLGMPALGRSNLPSRRPSVSANQYGDYEAPDYEAPDRGGGGRRPSGARRPPRTVVQAGPTIEDIPAPQIPVVPPLIEQMRNGKVCVWFHDDSLHSLKVYRYRLAVKFLNPLLGFENVATERAFSASPAVVSKFSEWSEPVEAPLPTEFFLTGAVRRQGRVTVTVFTRSTGQQVKKQFVVVPGQTIGEVTEVQLTNPIDGRVEKVPVNFATGAIAVEITYGRVDALGRRTAEMLYLDEKGRLKTKAEVNANRSGREYQRYKGLEAKERITRLAAEAARARLLEEATPPSGVGM